MVYQTLHGEYPPKKSKLMERHRHTEDILDELKPEITGKIKNKTSIQGRVPYTSIGNNYTLSINGRITSS